MFDLHQEEKLNIYLENLERAHEGLVDRHHGTRVIELAAIVGRREERDQLPFREELVTVLNHLTTKPNTLKSG